jgi:hypothetical protein
VICDQARACVNDRLAVLGNVVEVRGDGVLHRVGGAVPYRRCFAGDAQRGLKVGEDLIAIALALCHLFQ